MKHVSYFSFCLGKSIACKTLNFDSRSETVPSLANDRFRANDENYKVSNIRGTTTSRSESIYDFYDSDCLAWRAMLRNHHLFLFPHVPVSASFFFFPSDNYGGWLDGD